MKVWEKAEAIVAKLSGGYPTNGSGNKGQRGDVIANGHRIEVKSTVNKGTWSLLYSWFETLEKLYETTEFESVLALFFDIEGFVYYMDRVRTTEEFKKWSSRKIEKDAMPSEVVTKKYVWRLEPIESLRKLKK